ncbi:nuclear transport factor 2 family protein [Piscinibacter defluvii]|uniref:nuclear transport factor 2 family protein n=1 Tax=Piscinibacter defluvii TaxID=1796922 RepID=UPI000FDCEFF9|nr:nuclear transport factor 2 family protein [Piscinibacter defluvii]
MPSPTEIVQSLYAAFGRGDIAAVLDLLTDDVQWEHKGSSGAAYLRTARGRADVARWFGEVAELDEVQAFEPREFLAGTDHVTVLGWERTRARPAGGVFETDWMHVFTLRDGRVCRFVGLYDTAAALAARRAA